MRKSLRVNVKASSATPKTPQSGRSMRSANKSGVDNDTPGGTGTLRRSSRKKQEKCPPAAARMQLEESSEEEHSPVQAVQVKEDQQGKTRNRNRMSELNRDEIADFLDSTYDEEQEEEESDDEGEDETPKNSKAETNKTQSRGRNRSRSAVKYSSEDESRDKDDARKTSRSQGQGRGRGRNLGRGKNSNDEEGDETPKNPRVGGRRSARTKSEENASEEEGLRKSTRTPVPRKKMITEAYKHSDKSYLATTPSSSSNGPKLRLSSKGLRSSQSRTPVLVAESPDQEQQQRKTTPPPSSSRRVTRGLSQAKETPQKATSPSSGVRRVTRGLSQAKETPQKTTTTSPSNSVRRVTRGLSQTKETPKKTPVPASATTPRSTRKRAIPEEEATPIPTTSKLKPKNVTKTATPKITEANIPSSSSSQQAQPLAQKVEWKFNVYGIPKCPLPCRESQFEEVWKFLFENITEKNSGCMYVSGVPGTGKTVIVQAVVDTMQKVNEEKKNLGFKYLYINGLTLASPDKLWKRMFKGLGLTSKFSGISSKEALKRLDSYFESHNRAPVVLVVDELDQILDKQQSILYQLLEWSSHAKNMFSFLAIFNTMSLPEHGLAMRNNSRMGFKRAVFPPYSYKELQTIVLNMLSTFKTVRLSPECVSLLSRKVAAISGDARRALEIARRTLEIVESGEFSGMQAVSHAFKEIFSSAKIETIKHTSFLEQMILKTICDEIRCSGVEEVLIAKLYDAVIPKAVYEGVHYNKDEILKALLRLAVMRLVIVEDNRPSLHKRLLLKVPVEDVNFALGCHTDMQVEN